MEKLLLELGFNKKHIVNLSGNDVFVKRIHDRTFLEFEDGFLCLVRKSEIRDEQHSIIIPKKFDEENLRIFINLIS